jgi:ribonuclease HI
VEGAFDNIKFSSIHKAMMDNKIPPVIINWIYNMLVDRNIILEIQGKSITRKIYKGCPQGGILSPLLWNLTLNQLLKNNDLNQDFIQAFADDLGILLQGCDLDCTMRDLAIMYLKIIDKWCTTNGVKLSTVKTKVIIFRTQNRKYHFRPIVLNKQTLDLEDEIKYLGVIFDKHLSWAPHIKQKCATAIKLMNMCKNFVGKTWGISPQNIRWIFNQVVLPNLSYACFVWAHKINKSKFILNMLQKVQKMATLQITGGFSTTPTTTLDVLSGLLPIEMKIDLIATKTALRLKIDNNWVGGYAPNSRGKTLSHALQLDKNLAKIKTFTTGHTSDLISNTEFEHTYKISKLNNEECVSAIKLTKATDITIYTDGSLLKTDSDSAAGAGFIVIHEDKIRYEDSISLGTYASVNSCELYAIYRAAEWLNDSKITNHNIYIFTDSLSTLYKLEKGCTKSKLTLEVNLLLNSINKYNNIELIKVPAHIGIEGNEAADLLAKNGASVRPFGPEPFISFTLNNIFNDIDNQAKTKHLNTIQHHNIKNIHKTPILNYLKNHGRSIQCNNRKNLSTLTQLLSGQIHLAKNDHHRDLMVVPFCRHCPNIEETAEHFLTACPAYSLHRLRHFGHPTINFTDLIATHSINSIIKFTNDTKRLEDNYVCYFVE